MESVLEQSHEHLELVVFDDGSTDGSLELAHDYAGSDPRVRVLRHPGGENRGVSATADAAMAAAQGDYIAGLAADDVLFPESLARRARLLDADAEIGLAYGTME